MSHPAIALSPDLLLTTSGRSAAVRALQVRGMSRSAARDAVRRLTVAATGERLARRHSLGIARTAPEYLRENPNDGKRHVARMNPADADTARQVDQSRRPDLPVRVTEHRMTKRGRMSKRASAQYTAMRSDYR